MQNYQRLAKNPVIESHQLEIKELRNLCSMLLVQIRDLSKDIQQNATDIKQLVKETENLKEDIFSPTGFVLTHFEEFGKLKEN